MTFENINKDFVNRFFSELGKAYSEVSAIKEELKEEQREEIKEMRFIRPLTRETIVPVKKPVIKPIVPAKPIVKEPEKEEPPINTIRELMRDSTTNIIICYGADKRILIRKGNRFVETPYFFNEDRIKNIIKELAKEANTSVKKTFKANLKDFRINAIMSDFIGSKFALIRKTEQI